MWMRIGLATVVCIWRIYGDTLQVPSPYRRYNGRADCMAVLVRFVYGWVKSCADLISVEFIAHKLTDLKL